MFIVIDGIDSTGKETQVKLLEKNLKELGKKVLVLDYPRYKETSSFAVKKYLSGDYGEDISAEQASIFYTIDRFDSLVYINKSFYNYDYIISNRYVSSSMIHQGGKIKDKEEKDKFFNWLEDLEYNIFSLPKPDKTIFLHISLENSLKLLENRGNKKDLHENDINHLENAYNTALYLSEKKGWIQIECEEEGKLKKIEEINKMILKQIL